jgi:hypothetical protein
MTPVILFFPASSIAGIHGNYAEILELPTVWFAQTSNLWMLFLVVVSFAIPSPKWAAGFWLSGLACVAYAPLLVALGSSSIPLSRWLSPAETEEFRHRFPVPSLFYSASGEGKCLRVRRQDFADAMRSHLQSMGALRGKDASH